MCALQLSCPAHADTARPPLGLTESLQEGQRKHSSDLERAESLVRNCDVLPLHSALWQHASCKREVVALAILTMQML